MSSRPNILIIKSDQHNARCMGANGHSQIRTPNLDALARCGVNFKRAFVQNPICTPSRMCYLSGQYVHNHGVYALTNGEFFPKSLPSMFSEFKKAGYRTGIIGHIHVKGSWIEPHCDHYRNLHIEGSAYDKYLDKKGKLHLRDDQYYKGVRQPLDGGPSELPFEDSYEGYVFHSFREFLDEQAADQPFIYQMDTVHPHQSYVPCREFWDLYEGVELELPSSVNEDLSGKPVNHQQTAAWVPHYPWLFEPKTYEAGIRRKLRGYYGCISQVDHLVGLARHRLREIGREENTIILYCSDHGDFALEHGFLEKAPGISYDAILRTPFIWHWPAGGFVSNTVGELVESVDVFPTMCSLVGLVTPDTVDGMDISPMLRGDTTPLREYVFAEFPLSRTIRSKEWKLCHHAGAMYNGEDVGELYHISEDPWEMNNLYHDSACAEIREDLRRTLFDWILTTTRYACVNPEQPFAADGKVLPSAIKKLIEEPQLNYI